MLSKLGRLKKVHYSELKPLLGGLLAWRTVKLNGYNVYKYTYHSQDLCYRQVYGRLFVLWVK